MTDTARLVARVETKGVTKAASELSSFSKTAGKASKSTANFGRSAGQVGIQLQQLQGQIAGGQNAFNALASQAADIGIVMGAPLVGVTVAFGAALGGFLAPALFDSTDATEDLEAALESLDKIMDVSGEGVDVLSEKFIKLAESSEAAARIQIEKGLLDAGKAAKAAAELMEDSYDDAFLSMTVSAETFAGQTQQALRRGFNLQQILTNTAAGNSSNFALIRGELEQLQEAFKLTNEETAELGLAIANSVDDNSIKTASELRQVVSDLAQKYGQSNQKLIEFSASLSKNAGMIIEFKDRAELLKDAKEDLNGVIDKSIDKTEDEARALRALAREQRRLEKIERDRLRAEAAALKEREALFSHRLDLANDYRNQEDAANLEHLNEITRREEEAGKERLAGQKKLAAASRKLLDDTQVEKEAAIDRGFSNVAQLSTSGNKTLGAIGKAAAIAQTTRSGITAISNAAAINPYPVGLALAAAEGANMGLRLSQIRNAGNFANGGFIGGNSFSGDRITANVNSGEAVLNIQQQREFMNMANGGGGGGPSVIVNNNAPGTKATAQKTDDGRIVVIVQEVLNREVTQPNSNFNKNIDATRNAPRLRA